jgi:hypothetical protein
MSLVTEPPELELIRGEDLILSTTGYELTLELDPVLASQAGTYFCRSTVYVNGLIQPLVAESFTEVLTVLSKLSNNIIFLCVLTIFLMVQFPAQLSPSLHALRGLHS